MAPCGLSRSPLSLSFLIQPSFAMAVVYPMSAPLECCSLQAQVFSFSLIVRFLLGRLSLIFVLQGVPLKSARRCSSGLQFSRRFRKPLSFLFGCPCIRHLSTLSQPCTKPHVFFVVGLSVALLCFLVQCSIP